MLTDSSRVTRSAGSRWRPSAAIRCVRAAARGSTRPRSVSRRARAEPSRLRQMRLATVVSQAPGDSMASCCCLGHGVPAGVGLLDGVLGLGQRAQQPVGEIDQLTPLAHDRVHTQLPRSHHFDTTRHRNVRPSHSTRPRCRRQHDHLTTPRTSRDRADRARFHRGNPRRRRHRAHPRRRADPTWCQRVHQFQRDPAAAPASRRTSTPADGTRRSGRASSPWTAPPRPTRSGGCWPAPTSSWAASPRSPKPAPWWPHRAAEANYPATPAAPPARSGSSGRRRSYPT